VLLIPVNQRMILHKHLSPRNQGAESFKRTKALEKEIKNTAWCLIDDSWNNWTSITARQDSYPLPKGQIPIVFHIAPTDLSEMSSSLRLIPLRVGKWKIWEHRWCCHHITLTSQDLGLKKERLKMWTMDWQMVSINNILILG
jgi:hypothetical protein